MKTLPQKLLAYGLTFLFFSCAPVFAELKPLLPEKALWSVVHDRPAVKNWTTTYPLPKDRKLRGWISLEDGTWLPNKKYVFMTSELILPDDYEPGNLYAKFRHDDSIQVAINGTMVYQRPGFGANAWGPKRVPNLLKPGKNIIAVYCENYDGGAHILFSLYTDDEPVMREEMLFHPDGKWSVVFNDPGASWMKKSPLPGGKMLTAPVCIGVTGGWPRNKPDIWMTRVVTLPKDYKPGQLHAEYFCVHEIWLYVNGEEVLHRGLSHDWMFAKNIKNPLKPGKNTIAVRGLSFGADGYKGGFIGLDLWLEEKKADKTGGDSGFSMPTRPPKDAEEEEEDETDSEEDLTEAEKLIVKGMRLLKEGKEKPGVEALQAAAKADAEDVQANCILGMYFLTKSYKPASAMEYMQACVKIDAQNPCVLNNYGVAAMETKKYADALKAWQRLAKNYPTLTELQQNVGFLTELTDKNLVKLKDDERQKLETLFREVCGAADVKADTTAGFLLMPLHDGVGANPDFAEIFVQEYKRGKDKVTGNPYEVKRTYFQK